MSYESIVKFERDTYNETNEKVLVTTKPVLASKKDQSDTKSEGKNMADFD